MDIEDNQGHNCLHFAVMHRHINTIRALITHGMIAPHSNAYGIPLMSFYNCRGRADHDSESLGEEQWWEMAEYMKSLDNETEFPMKRNHQCAKLGRNSHTVIQSRTATHSQIQLHTATHSKSKSGAVSHSLTGSYTVAQTLLLSQ